MKPITFGLAVMVVATTSVHSQNEALAESMELQVVSILPTSARIVGNIPDGSPPPHAVPTPRFRSTPVQVRAGKTYQKDGRTISLQEIAPVALPVRTPGRPLTAEQITAFQEMIDKQPEFRPGRDLVPFGASVYRFADGSARTWATYWDHETGKQYSFWSSADFALITGISTFVDNDNRTHSLMLVWSRYDMAKLADLAVEFGTPDAPLVLPEFKQDAPATFVFPGEAPDDPEIHCAIQSLHDIYNARHAELLAAWQGRERARIAHEKHLRLHPPKPKDLTLKFWRTEKSAVKGGVR